ncbi:methyltransferase domain-containing protein [bacterium]|nr:methyltransferase domain-containing protein [bacterium]
MSLQYFTAAEAACRYDRYRPKVHRVLLDWLATVVPGRRFTRALDVACGTGDSTVPLMEIANQVTGIDTSAEMLRFAAAKGLAVQQRSYQELPTGPFDLISVCMAWHWFDRDLAISELRRVSAPSAIWLISNFAFAGRPGDTTFQRWLKEWYLCEFPSPPRKPTTFWVTPADQGLAELAHQSITLPLTFSREDLIGYLTTQSNVEARIQAGLSYTDAEQMIDATMPVTSSSGFEYIGQYTVVEVK